MIKRVSNFKFRTDFYDAINHREIKTAVEIGVEFGYNARDILNHIPSIEKLYLIDPFDGSLNKKIYWKDGRILKKCKENLQKYENKVFYIQKKSWESYDDFKDNSLDFIHIDGAHHVHGVITDIITWWPKVKNGCVFSGHDYYSKSKKRNVLPVVNWIFKDRDIYCTNESQRELVNSPSWWVIKEGELDFNMDILNKNKIIIDKKFFLMEEEYLEIEKI